MTLRRIPALLSLSVALLLAGCRDAGLAPAPQPPAQATTGYASAPDPGQPSALVGELIGGLPALGPLLAPDTVAVLQRDVALPAPITVTQIIGSEGGRVVVPGAGLTVDFPAGALAAPTPITVTALAGRAVAYEFGPHGITFAKPVTLTQDLEPTVVTRWTAQWIRLKGGYFKSQTDLISRLLRAIVQELIPANTDADDMVVRFDIRHFSGYLVAVD
ncbi:MAG TPA: hypothetical protein VHM67_16360 [Gemmatimonadaceae bacterium]|nr:hypothetical protein [Gemmatimonadaceae bacterium]